MSINRRLDSIVTGEHQKVNDKAVNMIFFMPKLSPFPLLITITFEKYVEKPMNVLTQLSF